ncbi:MAG: hypothetical protein ABI877_16160 [Gemmatimonadaceae bacterium]
MIMTSTPYRFCDAGRTLARRNWSVVGLAMGLEALEIQTSLDYFAPRIAERMPNADDRATAPRTSE